MATLTESVPTSVATICLVEEKVDGGKYQSEVVCQNHLDDLIRN